MTVIAKQVLHKDVAGVWLGREAIISVVNLGICHTEAIHIERIKAIRVGCVNLILMLGGSLTWT